jgi:hypothetical protein
MTGIVSGGGWGVDEKHQFFELFQSYLPTKDNISSAKHGKEQVDGCRKTETIESWNLTDYILQVIHGQEEETETTPVGQPKRIIASIHTGR